MRAVTLLILALSILGCATAPQSRGGSPKHTVIEMVNAIDTKNWATALQKFDEKVFVDYSSMNGLPGSEVPAAGLVGGWEKLLTNVETHHMLTNFDVTIDGDSAEVFSHVYASHAAEGIEYWDIYGRYQHRLKRTKSGWKITLMKLLVHGQKGNLRFLEQVSKK